MSKDKTKHDPILKVGEKVIANTLRRLQQGQPPSPEQVHELRVCTKKVRALLQLYRPFCGKTSIKNVEQKVKKLADGYSGFRDAQVLEETLVRLTQLYGQDQQQDVQLLLTYFAERNQKVQSKPPSLDPVKTLKNIEDTWKSKIRPKGKASFDVGMEYSYQKARKLAFAAESTDQDDTYHECRKWVKYYLYQLQMSPYKKLPDSKTHIGLIKQLAELLGLFHDRCELEFALNDLLQSKSNEAKALHTAALLMLSYLVEQKRADKEQCLGFFEMLFSFSCNPILGLVS